MADRRFLEAERWAEDKAAWKNPARLNDWIRLMQEIADNVAEEPAARSEAELLVKRLKAAKKKPVKKKAVKKKLARKATTKPAARKLQRRR